ncbi:MAG TPA: hypothetical protein VEU96_02630 [Bryobacteraceae bacterium]|nr:hypothetical protein [Bryobacteraceae bacterium]
MTSYEEIIDFIAAGTTPDAVIAFRPSDETKQHMADLVERSNAGHIGRRPFSVEPLAE